MLRALVKHFYVFLKSRHIFNNWLLVGIQYVVTNPEVLYKRMSNLLVGRKCIMVKCRLGGEVCLDATLYEHVIKALYLGFIDKGEVLCDNINNSIVIKGLPIGLRVYDDYIDINCAKFKHLYYPIIEEFIYQVHGPANVKDKVVVDVGAFVGDSSIYFALKGAKKIYAIEPNPEAFREMLENIKLNNLNDRIVPINAAIGSKAGTIRVANINIEETTVTYYDLNSMGSIEVPMMTLSQLFEQYGIEPDILKMDCEGCEYDVILNDYEHVKLFKEIIVEYHSRNDLFNELKLRLEQNYRCKVFHHIIHCVKL